MVSKNNQLASSIAVLGTGSEVGKSVVAAALCRLFSNQGIRVAPYKAQNMSNNSGVTPEGLEMGRAQIVQAESARIPPHVDMNPILLKPTGETGSQIVLLGNVLKNVQAKEYHTGKKPFLKEARNALDRLRKAYDRIVIEGAGSCAEVNLMPHDIVNLSIAEYADAPVILVADIHRGGVFAQIVGTLDCLPEKHRNRIAGFIINRFRGDSSLFLEGVRWIEERTKKKVFGVLPWYRHFQIEAEDSVAIEQPKPVSPKQLKGPAVAVIRVPHISNFTDFDPLTRVPGLDVFFIEKVQNLSGFKAIILPGSKNTRHDLNWLHQSGWTEKISQYQKKGGHILGICGGYQMMGSTVEDFDGLEDKPGTTEGLCLLPVITRLKAPKTTTYTQFSWEGKSGIGYEIHMGQTERIAGTALILVQKRNNVDCRDEDGCATPDMRAVGTYIHGLFDTPDITRLWLKSIGLDYLVVTETAGPSVRDADYDLLAEHFKSHIDTDAIETLMTG